MFRFAEPEYLLLLLIIPVLLGIFIVSRIKRRRSILRFGDPKLLSPLMPNVSVIRPTVKFIMQVVAVVLLSVVIARPQFGTR